jgi:type VI secretion system protein VasD
MTRYALSFTVVLMMICGCGLFGKDKPEPPPEPTRVVLEFETAGDINPNIAGRASPLVVRIYHLKSYSAFKDADFISLFEKESDALGGDLINKQEIYLKPNEKRTIYFEAPDAIRTVGILAAFRYYHTGRWKAAASIHRNKTNVFSVRIRGTSVELK